MPELPEVRAHAHRLTASHAGHRLESFRALSFTALKTVSPRPDDAYGHPLIGVGTRGKYLLVRFEPVTFVVHLMQGGRLKPDPVPKAKPRGGLARWTFADADALLLSEAGREHRAGVWVVADPAGDPPPMEGLGPEADEITVDDLAVRLAGTTGRLHGFLRDQRNLAGIGRRLANEICHAARLSPFAAVNRLDPAAVTDLHTAIGACIAESLADEAGRDHMARSAERLARVHHRTGEPCPVCGDVIREVGYRSYTVNYCATCQTGGKVLADNSTSRFLK